MLICPTCGANFEALKSPWTAHGVYVCSTRRRKPGMCRNEATLGMAHADTVVLDMIEGEILDTRYIDELLALVDNAPDTTAASRRRTEPATARN